jgi:hypothetical protein
MKEQGGGWKKEGKQVGRPMNEWMLDDRDRNTNKYAHTIPHLTIPWASTTTQKSQTS